MTDHEAAGELGDVEVLDRHGQAVVVRTLWERRPIVLTLIRHFGWLFCKEQLAQLRGHLPRIHAAGAELVMVGNGTPEQAGEFIDDYSITTPVYTDPSLAIHRAVGARRGGGGLGLLRNAVRALSKGHIQTRVIGDPKQHGGVFVITGQGEFAYSYLSEVAGDHPDPEGVVQALERVAGGRGE